MDLFSLKEKNVVLTGGCGNLGRVMAKWLLEYDANLFIADIVEDGVSELEQYIDEGRLHHIKCDLADSKDIARMYAEVKRTGGSVDVLINNAAYGGGAGGKKSVVNLEDVKDDIWNNGIDGTIGVTFRCIREALPYFRESGYGNIVNIASMYGMVAPDPSIYGKTGSNSPVTYGAGKAAVIQLTRYCAANLADLGVRCNCITPGPFPKITPQMDKEFYEKLKGKTMLGRTGNPDELAGPLLLLASEASSFMTGANIVVDGGWTAW